MCGSGATKLRKDGLSTKAANPLLCSSVTIHFDFIVAFLQQIRSAIAAASPLPTTITRLEFGIPCSSSNTSSSRALNPTARNVWQDSINALTSSSCSFGQTNRLQDYHRATTEAVGNALHSQPRQRNYRPPLFPASGRWEEFWEQRAAG